MDDFGEYTLEIEIVGNGLSYVRVKHSVCDKYIGEASNVKTVLNHCLNHKC